MNVGKAKMVRLIQKGRWSAEREMSHLIPSELKRPSCSDSAGEWRLEEVDVRNNCLETIHCRSEEQR